MNRLSVPRAWRRQLSSNTTKRRQVAQIERDLPKVYQILGQLSGTERPLPGAINRLELTQLQQELAQLTAANPIVADDEFLQKVRRQLHLLLDH